MKTKTTDMKRILPLMAILLASCNSNVEPTNPVEQALKSTVTEGKYTLIGYYVDTVTYADQMKAVERALPKLTMPSKEEYQALRDAQFGPKFCKETTGSTEKARKATEKKVMDGTLSGYDELRYAVIKADSLLARWDSLPPYSFDLFSTYVYFNQRKSKAFKFDLLKVNIANTINYYSEHLEQWKPTFLELERLAAADSAATYSYDVSHKYQLEGTSQQPQIKTDLVTLDTALTVQNVVSIFISQLKQ